MILCARARASMTASAAAARTLPRAQVVAGDVVDAIEGPVVFRGGTQQAQVANDGSGAWFGQGGYGRVRAVMTYEIARAEALAAAAEG